MDTRPAYLKCVDLGPPLLAVRQAIDDGEHWLLAWNRQSEVIYRHLARDSQVSDQRLRAIEAGDVPSLDELAKLSLAWRVSPDAIALTLPFSILP